MTFRSTHRLWFFFNAELKQQISCMRTAISVRDVAQTKGNAATRDPSLSPMCAGTQTITKAYNDANAADSFTWNNFPLDVANGEFLVVALLPGQGIDAVFTGVNKQEEWMPPLLETSAAMCGCIDCTCPCSFLPVVCPWLTVSRERCGSVCACVCVCVCVCDEVGGGRRRC